MWSATGGGAVSAFNLHLLDISTSAPGSLDLDLAVALAPHHHLHHHLHSECKTPQEQNDVVIYIKACIRTLNKQTLTM